MLSAEALIVTKTHSWPVLGEERITNRLRRPRLKSRSLEVMAVLKSSYFWKFLETWDCCFGVAGKECRFVSVVVSVRELISGFCISSDILNVHILKVGEVVIRLHLRKNFFKRLAKANFRIGHFIFP